LEHSVQEIGNFGILAYEENGMFMGCYKVGKFRACGREYFKISLLLTSFSFDDTKLRIIFGIYGREIPICFNLIKKESQPILTN
jgi:hypothetical protein